MAFKIGNTDTFLTTTQFVEFVNADKLKNLMGSKCLARTEEHDEEAIIHKFSQLVGVEHDDALTVSYRFSGQAGRVYATEGMSLGNLRKAVRHTLADGRYIDIDLENAHPSIASQLLAGADIEAPGLSHYVSNREDTLAEVMASCGCSRDSAKNLFIRLLYGGKYVSWTRDHGITSDPPTIVTALERDVKTITAMVCTANPELLASFKGKDNPKASLLALFLQDMERQILETMATTLKDARTRWRI